MLPLETCRVVAQPVKPSPTKASNIIDIDINVSLVTIFSPARHRGRIFGEHGSAHKYGFDMPVSAGDMAHGTRAVESLGDLGSLFAYHDSLVVFDFGWNLSIK